MSPFQEVNGPKVSVTKAAQECIKKLQTDFQTKMSDDLSTPYILNASLQEALRFINNSLNMLKVRNQTRSNMPSMLSQLAELCCEIFIFYIVFTEEATEATEIISSSVPC